ncbi:hypothetical protein [Streptomyces fractus]|uniref:hypothetical protein n=1 Tax=Streptomyces fractus TaxID=641806 RepID=UPI003CF78CBE
MSFFARASWPGDHRDEIVAGALAATVIVVLGYASGIGATADRAETAPPAVQTPASPAPSSSPADPAPSPPDAPTSDAGEAGAGNPGVLPVGGIPAGGGEGTGGNAGAHGGHGNSGGLPGDSGHSGHASPTPSPPASSTPSPTPSSPSAPPSCAEGEVRLVQPLLKGVLAPVTGLLGGPTEKAAKTDEAGTQEDTTPCVGLASDPSLLTELTP